ncbi:26s proteasome non-atpase regulatory subunit 8 [Anaeramoeba ignava]|uniref:26s proteasome non-atpase regulatory subunit 8 n=1 Tax=Anaeramoeba ignava TaxID=1746090 RepID=A0A9Q0R7I2_ANAIG|nr:26s proteasome non-atpase regulatory subunit 8 [Anaeramoeba ignava]
MDFNELYRLLSSFTNSVENDFPDFQYCNELLTQLKIQLAEQNILFSSKLEKQNIEGLKIARQTLEFAVILSVKMKENKSFERHISQLKPYYYDYENFLEPSELKLKILGIYLLFLLSQNRIAEFHTELELIKIEERKSKFISFPMRLEEFILDGNYFKIREAFSEKPSELFDFFLEELILSLRSQIAECVQVSYPHLKVKDAFEILMLKDKNDLIEIAQQNDWLISEDDTIHFKLENDNENVQIPSDRLIREIITYAKEMERII